MPVITLLRSLVTNDILHSVLSAASEPCVIVGALPAMNTSNVRALSERSNTVTVYFPLVKSSEPSIGNSSDCVKYLTVLPFSIFKVT